MKSSVEMILAAGQTRTEVDEDQQCVVLKSMREDVRPRVRLGAIEMMDFEDIMRESAVSEQTRVRVSSVQSTIDRAQKTWKGAWHWGRRSTGLPVVLPRRAGCLRKPRTRARQSSSRGRTQRARPVCLMQSLCQRRLPAPAGIFPDPQHTFQIPCSKACLRSLP